MNNKYPIAFARGLSLLVLWLALASATVARAAPETVVERLHGALIQSMRAGAAAGYDGRARQLRPVLEQTFDFPYIARLVVGKHAAGLDAKSIAELAKLLADLSEVSYADNFRHFEGQEFVVREDKEAKRGRRLVRTVLREDGRDKVTFDYLLHSVGGEWRIISVIAQGVSDLALKRSQYPAVIEKEGFDALRDRLMQQIERMRAQARKR